MTQLEEYLEKIEALEQEYGGEDNVPEEAYPEINIQVLIKTDRYKTVGSIGEDWVDYRESVSGVLVNCISHGPDNEEKQLLLSEYPNLNFNQVWILEEGRTPSSPAVNIAIMVFGALLILGSMIAFFFTQRR